MNKNLGLNSKIEKKLEENCFFILSESEILFKNDNQRISLNLNQIIDIRLIKNRDFTINIVFVVFAALFYFAVLHPLNIISIFQYLIVTLVAIFIIVMSCLKNYSYKLLINKNSYSYNEIMVSKKNLYYAKVLLSRFPSSSLLKNKVEQKFAFDYYHLDQHIA